ncbi:uncharacterized protein TEOVI_000495000 [Trypanosoma equiperdum]|uniref:Uncharacterized protein n=4 Tax=Trypanozoon TaxID=39700 RepID=Q385T7_TRYB2|nr:hypothetical protein, conserved [Trypanosoma brucei gambiense DAL972]XP_828556.1 hypothetical protein, conserved [Trypanosoma brucei brucei TREU927]RHW67278.1 hypothetical protein DPX39_000056500 [Trypanosoma brucei equiperdum]SCU66430.1 hypothetical protein, conserved [Trypanosoma equiperdum]EAN79444.1 hypothetical protein, conserved [Trypanosoma brucei brucei TREU927]CBH17425.1 hypothetical protein, conserved [Trypanosoma brucei gambiense DAL972]|eukprot:XP_011779689.1 hypothetical protein, conserved [Trypanosoma brucei gambiense DAL972]
MRALRLTTFITATSAVRLQSGGNYGRQPPREYRQRPHQPQHRFGGPRDGRPQRGSPPPQGSSYGGSCNRLSEPQLVAKLLEHFPVGKTSIPVNKWAPFVPEDIQEALVPFGGLAHFAASQTNFFIVRKENGLTVVTLSTMASTLCVEREKSIKKREEKAAAYAARRRDQPRRSH